MPLKVGQQREGHRHAASGGLNPKRAAGFAPAAQPNAGLPVWRLLPAIFVYFTAVSRYKNGMARFNGTKSSDAFGNALGFRAAFLSATATLKGDASVIEYFYREVPKHLERCTVVMGT